MGYNEIFKIIELVISFSSVVILLVGLILPFRHSVKLSKINQRDQLEHEKKVWKMNLLDEQISKYYGPISALLKEQCIIRRLIWEQIGRKFIFDENRTKFSDLSDKEQLIWKHYVDNYKIPMLQQIVDIMRNNEHLAVCEGYSEAVNRFLEYAIGWKLFDHQKNAGVPNDYEYYYSYNYPMDFDEYIFKILDQLMREKQHLLSLA